jgi:hypothetical protein
MPWEIRQISSFHHQSALAGFGESLERNPMDVVALAVGYFLLLFGLGKWAFGEQKVAVAPTPEPVRV